MAFHCFYSSAKISPKLMPAMVDFSKLFRMESFASTSPWLMLPLRMATDTSMNAANDHVSLFPGNLTHVSCFGI